MEQAALHPHRSSYGLNPKIEDPVEHQAAVGRVCEIYQQAPELAQQGIDAVSCDEKTGIPFFHMA